MSQPAGSRGSSRVKEGFPRGEHSSLPLSGYKGGVPPFSTTSWREISASCTVSKAPPKGSVEDPLLGGTKNSVKNDYLERILRARVYDVAIETPLEVAPNLSARLGNRVLLKREDMQPVFSFKCRGAYNKMANLSAAALARGVIASSAGNHAQGVALAAQKLGCAAVIVMPSTTPKIKVDAVKARGAEVHLHGDTYDEAHVEARRLGKARRLGFVHPYDDPDVIAGQGTIGMEILRQTAHPIHAVFVAIGGGGLVSGIASYIKRLRPAIKVVGVEPVDADAMARSLKARRRAGDRGRQGLRREIRGARKETRRCRLGREHEFRPAALCRRARRGGRSARDDPRGHHRRAPRQLQEVLRHARRAQHHRVQLPHRRSQGRARIRRRRSAQPRRVRENRQGPRAPGPEDARPLR